MDTPTFPCPKCKMPLEQRREDEKEYVDCPECDFEFIMPANMAGLGWLDKQLVKASGCGVVVLAIFANGFALVLGVVALIICKHPFARKRAKTLATIGGVITAIAVGFYVIVAVIFAIQQAS